MPSFYIVLKQQITGAGTFLNGTLLSRNSDQLNKPAARTGIAPLMEFFRVGPDELALAAKSGADTSKMKEQWFSAEDGLRTVRAFQNNLTASGIGDHERIASELQEFATVLELAKSNGVRWHLAIDCSRPTTNGCLEPAMEITTVQPFLHYFSNVRERTLRIARCVPPDQLDWSYAPGRFTLGDLLRHIAVTERYLFAENVQGHASRYTSHGKEFGESYDQILLLLDNLHKQSMEIFARLTDEDLQRKCPTPGGVQITTWKWLRSLAEHEIHHRGQLYLYLALLGVPTPPLYGLTSEQVRTNSLS